MDTPQQPAKKNWFIRHKVLSVLGILILLGIIASSSSHDSQNGKNSSTTSKSQATTAAMAKVGQAAADGKFTFTVNKLTCGATTVGSNQYLQATAQGQFCDLNLTVKNTGNEAQDLSDINQYLYDSTGKKYAADSTADIDAQPDASNGTWFSSINPGNEVSGDIYFDVPKGTAPVTAELHDSAFSGGVKVSLQ